MSKKFWGYDLKKRQNRVKLRLTKHVLGDTEQRRVPVLTM